MFKIFNNKLNLVEAQSLKTHKYRSVDKSILSNLVVKHYVNFVLRYVSPNIAPNTITFTGFVVMLINFLLVVIFDFELRSGTNLLSLISGISLFIYFTLDNIDGAQARKIKEMSSMGQLFDHGVDSCCVFFCMITLCSSLRLGLSYTSLLLIFTVMSGFYMSGLEEKYTGIFEFGWISGPTEGILFIILLHLLSAFFENKCIYFVDRATHSLAFQKYLSLTEFSPLFVILVIVALLNGVLSFIKSLQLRNNKKKNDIILSYVTLFIMFIPSFVLKKQFENDVGFQFVNLIILGQNFSLKYIEEVYSNIIQAKTKYVNIMYVSYILLTLFIRYYIHEYSGILILLLAGISTFYYLYSVCCLIKACKDALKINIFSLNKKKHC